MHKGTKINKKTNRVEGIYAFLELPQETDDVRYEEYDQSIHPWGCNGFVDIEPGPNWQSRYNEKMGIVEAQEEVVNGEVATAEQTTE